MLLNMVAAIEKRRAWIITIVVAYGQNESESMIEISGTGHQIHRNTQPVMDEAR